MRPQRRRWTSTLAEALPTGPEGQPAHPVGSEIAVLTYVSVPGRGPVSFIVPRPSVLLMESAERHLSTAARLRDQTGKQVRRVKWSQPGYEWSFANESLVFDFFSQAMAGIVLAFASLDNLANELMPFDFVYTDEKGHTKTREVLEASSGVELRLSRVAAAATGKPNLRVESPDLWSRIVKLKQLRDDLAHAKAEHSLPEAGVQTSIFARVYEAPLKQIASDIRNVSEYFLG